MQEGRTHECHVSNGMQRLFEMLAIHMTDIHYIYVMHVGNMYTVHVGIYTVYVGIVDHYLE